jgi:hypothetical protein
LDPNSTASTRFLAIKLGPRVEPGPSVAKAHGSTVCVERSECRGKPFVLRRPVDCRGFV